MLNTGLPVPAPPSIAFVPAEYLRLLAGAADADHDTVQGLYHRPSSTVYLPGDWDAASLRDAAVLLHELVHHAQAFNGVQARCPRALEREAYALTARWLRERGVVDPYGFLNTDEFTVAVRAVCLEPD